MRVRLPAACSRRRAGDPRWADRRPPRPCCGFIRLSGSHADLNSRNACINSGPEHLRQQRAARLAVAVLAGERAAVAHHQIRRALDELAVLANAGFALQIEADLHVNAAVAEVAVVRGLVAVLVEQRAEIAQIGARASPARPPRRPTLPSVGPCRARRRRARPGLANLPHRLRLALACTGACPAGQASCSVARSDSRASASAVAASSAPNSTSRKPRPFGHQLQVRRAFAFEAVDDRAFESFEADRLDARESPERDPRPRTRRRTRGRRATGAAGWESAGPSRRAR